MTKVLLIAIVLTFLLSVFNWYEEGYYQGFVFSNFGAVLGAVLSTVAYSFISKRKWLPKLPFAIAASVTTGISLSAYIFYALNGQAENSSESAGQVHVILVPMLLTAVGIALLLAALLVAWLQKVVATSNA